MNEKIVIKQRSDFWTINKIYRTAFIFIMLLSVFILIINLPPIRNHVVNSATLILAWITTVILHTLGEPVFQIGYVVSSPAINMEITLTCTGLYQVAVLIAGILVWPATTGERRQGIIIGSFFLTSVNILRIISIYYSAVFVPDWVPFIHAVFWEIVMILFVPLIWFIWIRTTSQKLW